MGLKEFFAENPKTALALSGGADSAYLLWAGINYGADIQPYYVKTVFQPQFEAEDAARLCDELGIGLRIIEFDILSHNIIADNPADRCYYCKRELFSAISETAARDGYTLIIDGTNASDDISDRPGVRALAELSVRSPLRECNLTKSEIRTLSKQAGLFTWDKPAYACLATRIPTGEKITAEYLCRIEKAESVLFDMGFSDFRVRVYKDAARVQIKSEQFEKAAAEREKILERIKPYFDTVFLDMEAR